MTLKIGLIGCGWVAPLHVKGYLKVPQDAQVTAVCDIAEANAQHIAAELGGDVRIFSDYRTLLAEGEVDAVDICLPHHLHKDVVVAAAAAGKHILCEKPLCLTLEEADTISHAVAESGVTLMCAHNYLFLPAVQKAKQMLMEGALGQIYSIRTVDAIRHPWNIDGAAWRSRKETMGGGELIDTGYHPSYLLLHLADSVPTEVTAMLSSHRLHTLDGEDSAQVLVRFANGVVGNITTSWAYDPPSNTGKFAIAGDGGHMHALGTDLHYTLRGSEPVTIKLPKISSYELEVVDFVACLRDKRRPIQTATEGINVLKLILAAYQSEAEKRTVLLH